MISWRLGDQIEMTAILIWDKHPSFMWPHHSLFSVYQVLPAISLTQGLTYSFSLSCVLSNGIKSCLSLSLSQSQSFSGEIHSAGKFLISGISVARQRRQPTLLWPTNLALSLQEDCRRYCKSIRALLFQVIAACGSFSSGYALTCSLIVFDSLDASSSLTSVVTDHSSADECEQP